MTERLATGVGPARIDVAYELLGDASAPPVLLIMGAGAQMIWWPDGFCAELTSRGLRLIRFDNRDAGRSTHFADAGVPDMGALLAGDLAAAPYTLSDMAADAAGLLEALDIESAHVVGASLGGMVAQTLAIEHPSRVRSLTSIMSTTGDRAVGQAEPATLAALAGPPADREAFIRWQVGVLRALAPPRYAFDEVRVAELAAQTWDRGHDAAGLIRQFAAVVASGDRTSRLRTLRVPALVIHGDGDPLIGVSGGRATAAALPGAELVIFEGMGHGLPQELWADIAARISVLASRAEAAAARRSA